MSNVGFEISGSQRRWPAWALGAFTLILVVAVFATIDSFRNSSQKATLDVEETVDRHLEIVEHQPNEMGSCPYNGKRELSPEELVVGVIYRSKVFDSTSKDIPTFPESLGLARDIYTSQRGMPSYCVTIDMQCEDIVPVEERVRIELRALESDPYDLHAY